MKMQKEKAPYEEPSLKIVLFNKEDILTGSDDLEWT